MPKGCCQCKKKNKNIPKPPDIKRTNPNSPSIIIVGAGISGLACAVKLIEFGIKDVIILEAENRIGGRVHTFPFADNIIELGAQFVHGQKDNVVYEMVADLNVLRSVDEYYAEYKCIRSNGAILPDEDANLLKDTIAKVFEDIRPRLLDYGGTFLEYLEDTFTDEMSRSEFQHIDKEVVREFFDNFTKMESSESATGLNDVSTRGFLEYWECQGDYLLSWQDKGFYEFIRLLTRSKNGDSLGVLKNKIIFGAKVQKINWNNKDGSVSVKCEKFNEPFTADNIVVTVPLGVLKKFAADMFVPPLPDWKMRAVEGLGYGHVFKVYLEFPKPFWPSSWRGFTTLWRKEDLRELRMNGLGWVQEIYGFYCMSHQPRVLEAWAVGPEVLTMEKISSSELKIQLVQILRKFLPFWDIPDPNSIMTTSWSNNPNFLGAYSFRTVLTESLGTSAIELAKPLDIVLDVIYDKQDGVVRTEQTSIKPPSAAIRSTIKPTVLFAGEATSPHYFSTVHGALESGWREAKRLAGYYDAQF